MTELREPFGAELVKLKTDVATATVEWLRTSDGECPAPNTAPVWAVVQSPLTIAWGIWRGRRWEWSWTYDPGVYPVDWEKLREARIFGPQADILIWRDANGLTGRVITSGEQLAPGNPRRPLERQARFEPSMHAPVEKNALGEMKPNLAKTVTPIPDSPFVTRTLPNGRITVTPTGEQILLLEYLSEDQGILRVSATRFLEVT